MSLARRSTGTSRTTPTDEQPPGIAVVRLDGDLFFATADALEDRIRDVIDTSSRLEGIVLDCEGINFVDSQGSAKMAEIARLVEESGLTLRLARVKPAVAATLDRDGVLKRIGPDHIHGNVHRAVQAQKAATADKPTRSRPNRRISGTFIPMMWPSVTRPDLEPEVDGFQTLRLGGQQGHRF